MILILNWMKEKRMMMYKKYKIYENNLYLNKYN